MFGNVFEEFRDCCDCSVPVVPEKSTVTRSGINIIELGFFPKKPLSVCKKTIQYYYNFNIYNKFRFNCSLISF